jgi:hypothetical protein
MMTELQRLSMVEIYEGYNKNYQKFIAWGSRTYCEFNTYMDENSNNIVCGVTTIDGISDSDQVFVKTENVIIEEDGKYYVLEDLFTKTQVVSYLQKLKPFDWHG